MVCDAKATHRIANCPHHMNYISSSGSSCMRCLVVGQDEGWAMMCSVTNKTQDMNQIAETRVYISFLPDFSSILFSAHVNHTATNLKHCQSPELSQHHVTCTIQHLPFYNRTDILHNFVHLLGTSVHYI